VCAVVLPHLDFDFGFGSDACSLCSLFLCAGFGSPSIFHSLGGAFPIFFNSAPDLVFSAAARTERISRAPDFLLLSEQALPYPVSRYGFRSVLGEGATLDSFFVD
jgi:hypothetical protein